MKILLALFRILRLLFTYNPRCIVIFLNELELIRNLKKFLMQDKEAFLYIEP